MLERSLGIPPSSEPWLSALDTSLGKQSSFCACFTSFILEALDLISTAVLLTVVPVGKPQSEAVPHLRCFLRPGAGGRLAQRHSAVFRAAHKCCGEWLWRRREQVTECSILLSPVICPLAFIMLHWQWLKKKVSFEAAWNQAKQQLP